MTSSQDYKFWELSRKHLRRRNNLVLTCIMCHLSFFFALAASSHTLSTEVTEKHLVRTGNNSPSSSKLRSNFTRKATRTSLESNLPRLIIINGFSAHDKRHSRRDYESILAILQPVTTPCKKDRKEHGA